MSDDAPLLSERVEALLAGSDPEGLDWEARALAIETRLQDLTVGSTEAKLLEPPALVPEPGEPASAPKSAPPPRSSTTQLSDLARAVAQKSARAVESELYKETLSVAAAARAQSPSSVRSVRTRPPVPNTRSQLPTVAAPAPSTPVPAPSNRSILGPFLAGAAVAIAAAAVVALLLRPPAPAQVPVATAPLVAAPIKPGPAAAPRAPEPEAERPSSPPEALAVAPSAPTDASPSDGAPRRAPQPAPELKTPSAAGPVGAPGKAAQTARATAPTPTAATQASKSPAPEHIVLEETPESKGAPAAPSAAPEPGMRIASGASNTVPDRPSGGAVQAALGSVLGAARACVAGTDAASTATVVFTSSGSVARVTVSGPAAGTPAGNCIQSALGRAKVSPFAQPTYVVNGVAIRP